jgi:GINS complex subunit 3
MTATMGDYFDVNQILSEDEPIAVSFRADVFELGFLKKDQAEDDDQYELMEEEEVAKERRNDIKKGTEVHIPLWLAKSLRMGRYVHLQVGDHFSPGFRLKVKAGASQVNLHAKSPYYYYAGRATAPLTSADREESIRELLAEVYAGRFASILNTSESSAAEHSHLKEKLAEMEQNVFDQLHRTSQEKAVWWGTKR